MTHKTKKLPCPCPCHRSPGMVHITACCNDGFIEVPEDEELIPVIKHEAAPNPILKEALDAANEATLKEFGKNDEYLKGYYFGYLACAEKYTAIIEDLKQKHEERILILALDMQKKDQEIERLREFFHLISGTAEAAQQDIFEPSTSLRKIKQYCATALTQIP